MRVDLHVHTRESSSVPEHWLGELLGMQECYTQPEMALAEGLRKGLDAVAVTNHDAAGDALRMARAHPGRVIPGCEYQVYAGGDRYVHVVVLGIDEGIHERLLRERSRGLGRFTGLCRREGLAFFLAHPAWEVGRRKRGMDPAALCEWLGHFDVIETLNSNSPAENGIASGLARYFRKARVGGSDAHDAEPLGTAWTEAEAGSVDEFLERVKAGEARPGGHPRTRTEFAATTREVLGAFYRREFLKTVRAGTFSAYVARATLEELVRTAGEILIIPAYFISPRAGTEAYFDRLEASAERLRVRLKDFLELELVREIAAEDLANRERERRFVAGVRELDAAFGGAQQR